MRDRPDLVEPAWQLTKDVIPEYNNHGDVLNVYWPRLDELPDFQFHVLDGEGIVARARSITVRWDGTLDDLPAGIDGAMPAAFELREAGERPDTLCAMGIEIPPRHQRRGLSGTMLAAMAQIARDHGLGDLIAPVRPSAKELYPLTPIDRYASWKRDDGLPFDPWMRVHARAGAEVVRAEPRSLYIEGSVAEWEAWTAMAFPESGTYVFPRGLAPLTIDRERGAGLYWEPNVWMRHRIG